MVNGEWRMMMNGNTGHLRSSLFCGSQLCVRRLSSNHLCSSHLCGGIGHHMLLEGFLQFYQVLVHTRYPKWIRFFMAHRMIHEA